MNDDLEANLRSALGHASERAPHAPSSLSAHIVARSRRRGTRARALATAAAALAVAVVAGGLAVAVRGAANHPDPTAADPTAVSSAGTAEPRLPGEVSEIPDPVEKVWPQAVRKIPALLPDGRELRPHAFIDDHTLLTGTWSSLEKSDALYAYDMDSAKIRKITDIPTPKGTVTFAFDFTIGAGQVVWWTTRNIGDEKLADLWAAPLAGGEARLVASHRNGEEDADEALDPPAVTGDGRIAFSFRESDGVFTVPLGGGAVKPVAGAERHHVMRWPWVGTAGMFDFLEETTSAELTALAELLNVETGEKRTAVVNPGELDVQCGLTACIGRKAGGGFFHRLRDGSREKELPFVPAHAFGDFVGRFQSSTYRKERKSEGALLHDLVTGRSGDFGVRPGKNGLQIPGPGAGMSGERLISYRLGDQRVVIDLSKID
ncbi:TolB family protein [Streptosporangium sp. LJ11]|uniref:TolB family protein n=1 Tax=Streptosporangium sp. LJ11 TaxID=3436927 RepID=UPI003F795A7F